MSFLEHLAELRRRLVIVLVSVTLSGVLAFFAAEQLFAFLLRPLQAAGVPRLISLSPIETFMTYLKLAVVSGLFATAPVTLAQIWLFVAPGLYPSERRWIIPFVTLGTLFFVGGAVFAYKVALPMSLKYFVSMVPESVEAQYSVQVYFDFVIALIVAFGSVFELPLGIWIASAAGVVSSKQLSRFRRYWLIVALIIAAILSDPSPISQLILAVPLLAFYELGVLGAWWIERQSKARTGEQVGAGL